MLITNRRVSQNVVERLRGVDRQSGFHATYIEGDRLSQYLAEQPKLLDEYFSKRLEEIEKLAREQAEEMAAEQSLYAKSDTERPAAFGSMTSEWSGTDLSGTFASTEGILELSHDTATDTVEGNNLEGLWFEGLDLEHITFHDMITFGNRRSHRRIE